MEVAYLLNNKYRVHEVAKDFKKNSKEITDILTKYATAPKNHMQVLEDRELSLIFEYLTQHNQVDNIESIYAEVYREPKAAPAPKGELGGTVGRASCAMLALTDVGLAAALLARLAAGAPETYGAASAELSEKADKALQRQKEQRRHEKKLQKGGRKPWAAPPARKESPPEPAGKRTLPRGRLTVKKKTP